MIGIVLSLIALLLLLLLVIIMLDDEEEDDGCLLSVVVIFVKYLLPKLLLYRFLPGDVAIVDDRGE
jgi:hypothetical protein